jgi:hypothetical protein
MWIGKRGVTASGYNGGSVKHQSTITVNSLIVDGATVVLDQKVK